MLYDPPELNRAAWDLAAPGCWPKCSASSPTKRSSSQPAESAPSRAEPSPGTRPSLRLDADDPCPHVHPCLDDGSRLDFTARRGAYGTWHVDPVLDHPPHCAGRPPTPFADPIAFLTRARRTLGLDGATLGHLIRELSATLAADARLDHTALTADQLADLGYADLEGHQTGHPWLVPNKGRLGFSAAGHRPLGTGGPPPHRLPWIAVSAQAGDYRGVDGLDTPDRLYARELDPATRETFDRALRARGLDPADYLYLPVHPWQWDEVVLRCSPRPSRRRHRAAPAGADTDLRLPQQSIRTFPNMVPPDRHTVKLPLSVLNTLVWRGLPTERTLAAPAVTAWVHSLRDATPSSGRLRRHPARRGRLGLRDPPRVRRPARGPVPVQGTARRDLARAARGLSRPRRTRPHARLAAAHRPPGPVLHRGARGPLGARPRGVAAPPLRRAAAPAAPLPLPLRHGLLAARRERHRRLRRARTCRSGSR